MTCKVLRRTFDSVDEDSIDCHGEKTMPGEASVDVKAAVIREKSGKFLIEDLSLEAPRSDEVLIRVAGVGVCHTDLVCRDQYFPVPLPCVFGHEGSGIVESVGKSVTKVKPGDRVVLSFLSCGHCEPCLEHSPGYCHELYDCNFAATRLDASTTLRKGAKGSLPQPMRSL